MANLKKPITHNIYCDVCNLLVAWRDAIWHSGKLHCSYACIEVTKDRESKNETCTV